MYKWKYFDVVLVPDHKINFHAISLLAFAVLACDGTIETDHHCRSKRENTEKRSSSIKLKFKDNEI